MTASEFFKALDERFTNLSVVSERDFNSEDTLFVVVDMVNGFCKSGALASDRCDSVTNGIVSLLKKLDKSKKAFIRDCHSNESTEFSAFAPHCHNTVESALVDELKNFKGADIPKNSTNGVYSLLKAFPKIGGFKNILIVGVCVDICILQLALSLKSYLNEMNLSVGVNVISDLVETYDSPTHEADYFKSFSLALMQNAGVNILKSV